MRRSFVAAGLLAAFAAGLNILPRQDASSSTVGLSIQRKEVRDPMARDLQRKRNPLRKRQTLSQTLDNEEALYFANVTVGTPSQNVRLHIDTGSSDMWVNTANSEICTLRVDPCSTSGTYNANASSSYSYVSSNFNVNYVDGSGASGDYATDDVGIGGKTLKSLEFGIGYESLKPEGILGIGYQDNEGILAKGGQAYNNMPMAMVADGLIKSNAYSLWLDDLEANTGSILFGGIDTDKFQGSLQTLPVQKQNGVFAQFIITLSGLTLQNGGQNSSTTAGLPAAVILDTGSSITYLPADTAQVVFNALDAQFSPSQGAAYASCNLAKENITLDFEFSSVTISVPITELIINPSDADTGNGQSFQSQDQLCLLGITSSQGEAAVLGDTFLRSAYVVFDLANDEVSLAQTNFNSTSISILEIGTGSSSVPDATPVSNPVVAAVTTTGGTRIGPATSTTTLQSAAIGLQVSYAVVSLLGLAASAFLAV